MTRRAGEALPTTVEGRDMLEHSVQYVPADADRAVVAAKIAAIEQEVRDDIRAFHDSVWHSGCNGRCDAMRMVEGAAISSSSATENRHESATPVVTQDGELPTSLDGHDFEETWQGDVRVDVRCRCGKTPMDVLADRKIATPTPDDRDREVERIGAAGPTDGGMLEHDAWHAAHPGERCPDCLDSFEAEP